jgi:hypothetical protein
LPLQLLALLGHVEPIDNLLDEDGIS